MRDPTPRRHISLLASLAIVAADAASVLLLPATEHVPLVSGWPPRRRFSARMLVIARDLPNLLCLGYLCVSLPVRIVQALRRRSIGFYSSAEMVSILNMDKDVENTAEAEHVRALLRPPKPERIPLLLQDPVCTCDNYSHAGFIQVCTCDNYSHAGFIQVCTHCDNYSHAGFIQVCTCDNYSHAGFIQVCTCDNSAHAGFIQVCTCDNSAHAGFIQGEFAGPIPRRQHPYSTQVHHERVLFIFSFFMFFYNIFIGFVSCLLRIIKSIVIGALMLPRLDNSALPRRFQMMDPGFVAYCGFVTLEASHTHPVLVMFLRLLMSEKEKRDKKALEEDPEKYEKVVEKTRAFIRARIRWQTAYSILNNPALRAYRKSQMDYVKQMQERLSKLYFIDKKQAGELVKKIDAAGMDANDVEDMINSGVDINEAAKKNWSKALVMGGFMQRMQRDMMMKKGMFAVDSENTTVNTAHSKTHINGGYVHDTVTSENDVKVYEQTPQNRWKMATFNALTKENENKQNYEASTEL
ncbi:STRA6-like protein [Mya arenaria]|uniref:STRA6-like protein n=1 Tax=Mya arenaria TaxID=6604 RepID=A0ABY7FYY2_MYAAR|nr:STRA6-like protein [Mya arenaria]